MLISVVDKKKIICPIFKISIVFHIYFGLILILDSLNGVIRIINATKKKLVILHNRVNLTYHVSLDQFLFLPDFDAIMVLED